MPTSGVWLFGLKARPAHHPASECLSHVEEVISVHPFLSHSYWAQSSLPRPVYDFY